MSPFELAEPTSVKEALSSGTRIAMPLSRPFNSG